MIWKIRSTILTIQQPLIVGILNLTPDSFYDGGRFVTPEQALERAHQLVSEGADLLDLGAESTRPNADPVSEEEERARLLPVLEALIGNVPVPISIDTTKSGVARSALERGAHVINDVSAFKQDPEMAEVVREFGAGIVLMHRRGTPRSMQSLARYGDLVQDVSAELSESMEIGFAHGVGRDQMVIDPGIGFSKSGEQSLELIERLSEFQRFGRPILVGPSRKSFIGYVTDQGPDQRLHGTISSCVLAYERGARIFRVHDVAATKEALLVAEAILSAREQVTV